MYQRVPDHLRGRLLGVLFVVPLVFSPIGAVLAGALLDCVGLVAALACHAASGLLTSLAPVVFPVYRKVDRAPTVRTRAAGRDDPTVNRS